MPLSYETVVGADLSGLTKAASRWRVLPDELVGIANSFRPTVTRKLSRRDWDGKAAEAGRRNFTKVYDQLEDASKESKAVYGLIRSAVEELERVQKKLKGIASEVAESTHLSLNKTTGKVLFDSPEEDFKQRQTIQRHLSETINEYNTEINTLVNRATEADRALNWALMQDRNGSKPGFNAGTVDSIKAASKSMEEAVKQAKEAEEILGKGEKASDREMTRLNSILTNRQGDPYFTEKFTAGVGAKKLFVQWNDMVNDPGVSDGRAKIIEKLQKSLGTTLATATHSDSDAMKKWKNDVLDLGPDRIELERKTPEPGRPPYNFQVMSALMREGDYDSRFLINYGEKLIDFDKKMDSEDWKQQPDNIRLNFGGDDHGADPMRGYMHALGNNPDAAKEALNNPHDLRYLIKERDWVADQTSVTVKPEYQHRDLGRALQSASLGVPWDETGINRDAETAKIAREVMKIMGEDVRSKENQLLHNTPGLVESAARIGSGYIDELTKATAMRGGFNNAELIESGIYDSQDNGIGDIPIDTARDFMIEVAKHSSAYEAMATAQHIYTASVMEDNAGDRYRVQSALDSGAYNQGIMASARNEYLDSLEKDERESADKDSEESGSWTTWSLAEGTSVVNSAGGAAAGAAIGGAIAGPPGAAVGMVAFPIVGDLAISAFEHYMGFDDDDDKSESKQGAHSGDLRDQISLRLTEMESSYTSNHDGGRGLSSAASDKQSSGWSYTEGILKSLR
ncbi:hypothetical protein JGS22_023720 [Streptomyces sp. P38-E01]|uniref:Uncharacterized protein n=1 Tax=Streptomyces tardus TaxID=2780544 RepID=A0A949JKT8_9ACTN|nr:hypothetical protein [Streptomyces tardus]MBU7600555.1 hypothetical protein [Streptomyces tardus]